MTSSASNKEFLDLMCDLAEGRLSPRQTARLEELLRADPAMRRKYVDFLLIVGGLHRIRGEGRGAGDEGQGMAGSPAIEEGSGVRGQGSEFGIRGSGFGDRQNPNVPNLQISKSPNQQISCAESPAPPIILDLSTPLPYSLSSLPSFVGGPVYSYMVATVIVGLMLLGAWAYKITHYQQFDVLPSPSSVGPEMAFVGQITGMKDCRWADPQTETFTGASVSLSRKYALSSGLMEITYKSGAKVILEGPCTYQVASDAGGYLALGKLTARVVSGQWPVASAKQKALNPKSPNLQISKSPNLQVHSPLSTLHSPLFSVRTPTAIVTDLGTEFGVEVSDEGDTTSHVFQGSVRMQVVGDDHPGEVVLRANESARVEKGKGMGMGEPRLVTGKEVGAPPKFVRRVYEPPKLLDLLDIVAGGNGTGNRRERGIDPVSGRIDSEFTLQFFRGLGRYNLTPWSQLIDGVFVPDGFAGAVQLDSDGHSFDGFPSTSGAIWAVIWSRGAEHKPELNVKGWIYQIDQDPRFARQFMPEGRGLLSIHPNAGITFDLGAMRKMYSGIRPARFKGTAGVADARPWDPEADAMADLWVLIDGRLKWKRTGLRPQDGAVDLDVEIGPNDRFLTLVSTDGNGDNRRDWVVFGDPALEMTAIEERK